MRDIPRAYEIALGAEGDAVLARWGASLARDPGVGEPWDTYGPGVTGDEPDRVAVPLTVDGDPTTLRSRSEEHTSELQSLMRISYAVFCLKKKTNTQQQSTTSHQQLA